MSFRVRCPSGLGCGLQHRIHGFESRPDFQFIYGHGIKAVPWAPNPEMSVRLRLSVPFHKTSLIPPTGTASAHWQDGG